MNTSIITTRLLLYLAVSRVRYDSKIIAHLLSFFPYRLPAAIVLCRTVRIMAVDSVVMRGLILNYAEWVVDPLCEILLDTGY